jgi:hypothetical protein|tara:strand:- start:8057 stop:8368 length:312 start_codon:yes stop_codon:yes gene_type:complete
MAQDDDKSDVEQFEEFGHAFNEELKRISATPLAVRKSRYDDLVGKVERINWAAAQYMKGDALKLETFAYSGKLMHVFNWTRTPQGHEFWLAIFDKLTQQENLH